MLQTYLHEPQVELHQILDAANVAGRMIQPAFPLEATVAVNPFLGHTGDDLATASARLRRVAGARATQSAHDYARAIREGQITDKDLADALAASSHAVKPSDVSALKGLLNGPDDAAVPLPTLADLAAGETGIHWPSIVEKTFGLWAAGYFDKGQALWSASSHLGAYAAWRAWATHDLTPEIAGLSGLCAHVSEAPDSAERAILRAAATIGLSPSAAPSAFHRLHIDIGGWSQHARWMLWQAELAGGSDNTLLELLAIRLVWEEAIIHYAPNIVDAWQEVVKAHAEPILPTAQEIGLAIFQDAAERAYQRQMEETMPRKSVPDMKGHKRRPKLQAAFCIDVRSEVFRRALESADAGIETIGFAGFFGLPLSHKAEGSDICEAHLPVLLSPKLETSSHCDAKHEHNLRIKGRAARAWGRFRQAAVSSFAFIEAAGPVYAAKLAGDSFGYAGKKSKAAPAPHLISTLSLEEKAGTAAAVLKAMSLTKNYARVVLLLGHGGRMTNNPHESAYHCGACGGYTGEVSARLLAQLLNDPETRSALKTQGIIIPDDTRFVAGLHETTTDRVTVFDADLPPASGCDLEQIHAWLKQAEDLACLERSVKLPGAEPGLMAQRARNWAEIRPEWGLAGCAAFIAAPRALTAGASLDGRAFLHSYDWQQDENFETLELILTAPVVVGSWISLQYYGSAVAPDVFGGGNKLIHNVVGGIGVLEGNGGRLRTGLPLQTIHDGEKWMHHPLRLSVMIEAPQEAITGVLKKHQELRTLFDHSWLHLFVMKEGRVSSRYLPGLCWESAANQALAS
ncbi:YbcC family protein [Rhizobium sp. L1K21]|uniref:YbcC family protein n=1 Tax=Rhizobium sp. L1K21 TaxID=2954933 RepID=UPI002092DB65|nr:DUF2309 domain-containing protein [Rhizobium sp. L1K21]MCO6188600.1 DUF2309 domain-containing protein [Rhizobium sp. L1K21]